ncbi:MAG: ABC transporter substrate-binding protein [Caldilineaceae bacterium]
MSHRSNVEAGNAWAFVAVLLLVLLIGGCAMPTLPDTGSVAEAKTPLRVTIFPYLSFSPLYIAQEEGYFSAEGLDVEFVRFQRNSESLTALLRGEVDVDSIFTVGLLNAIARGENVRVVANKGVLAQNGCPADGFVARAGLETAPDDLSADSLRSLKFGVDPTWLDSYLLQQWLAQHGVDISEVETEYLPDPATRVEALRQGTLDIVFMSEPWISRAQESGAGALWLPAADIAPSFPLGVLAFGPSLLEGTGDAGARFLRAYLKGIEQYNQGKTQRNMEIIASFSQLDADLLSSFCWPTFAPDGYVDAEAMSGYAAWATEQGLADRALAPDEFWDPHFLSHPNETGQ